MTPRTTISGPKAAGLGGDEDSRMLLRRERVFRLVGLSEKLVIQTPALLCEMPWLRKSATTQAAPAMGSWGAANRGDGV